MKARFLHIVILLAALLSAACTQNDGHIGPIFGSWSLENMGCEGAAAALPEHTATVVSFQSDIVIFTLISTDSDDTDSRYGTWTKSESTLSLDFTHSGDDAAAGTGIYAAPEWLHFPQKCVFPLTVRKLDSGEMLLEGMGADGKTYNYKFKRTW